MHLSSKKVIFAIILLAAAGGFFVMFGPPKLMARTETPDFCASCHVMESQYEAWFHTGVTFRAAIVPSFDKLKDVTIFSPGLKVVGQWETF